MPPIEGPLQSPNHPVFPLPENTGLVDLGLPPPSHLHINGGVPPRNEELAESQGALTDFREVLRKKHAAIAAFLSDRVIPPSRKIVLFFIIISVAYVEGAAISPSHLHGHKHVRPGRDERAAAPAASQELAASDELDVPDSHGIAHRYFVSERERQRWIRRHRIKPI